MNADGSPTLLSGPAPTSDLQLATADATDNRFNSVRAEWGVYLSGTRIIEPDSIVALDYRREWRIADYPLEKGAFESYDKVAIPFDIHLRMTKGGSDSDRDDFLYSLEQVAASLNLLDVATPEITYLSVNITSLNYMRSAANGVGLLTVDVGLRQIRVTVTSEMGVSTVANVTSTDPVTVGQVQPVTPSAPVAAAATTYLGRAHVISTGGGGTGGH